MTDIHALIEAVRGTYQPTRISKKPADHLNLLSFKEPILADCQVVFWYSKDIPYDTARWLAKDFAVDLKRALLNATE